MSLSFPPVGGYGETNEEGVAAIRFRAPGHLDGPVDTYTEATVTYRSGGPDCTDLQEYGGKADNPAFIVTD